ncbi:DEAD/DEAH box helicase [Macrococcoides canis]|uniref:DEAD/DEAH box helicase n=1 Tax=Macrococcoides canis TaxID=1855823 RepID=UPI0010FC3B78|nr:DEAD/DEAH box helicase family protein [Macrococcus canis]QCT73968.1 DEAD/DEAH box helicase [Macrococcus canis]DAC81066.1 TPA_inf: DEAD/DEAH box helicase [Macrococcus canis]
MISLPKGLFDFQEDCVSFLIDETTRNHRKNIIVKSPTGSGKTIMLIAYIDKFIEFVHDKVAFIWLTPGDGELEEQSKSKMLKYAPHLEAFDIHDALSIGFKEESTTFINWQMVTNKNNKSITDNERKNLYDRIAQSHREGIEFIVIVDEEHKHNTAKANNIINAFSPKNIIRVSATARENTIDKWYEIPEVEVINSGLITKAMYINEGVDKQEGDDMYQTSKYLLELADAKRKEILDEYNRIEKNIRPLIIIQFPNSSDEYIKKVENQLADLGYTYENKMVAKWMADEKQKINLEGITSNNGTVSFLLIKQAISTGWDCPRAKILIKLREGMDEDFEIQTIGRIRRMPEAEHYENEVLDCCYLYTFDEKYKEAVKKGIENSYETVRLFLKNKAKSFQLPKELRDKDYDGIGLRDIYSKIYSFFIDKYNLGNDKVKNRSILQNNGYIIGTEIYGRYMQGKFITFEDVEKSKSFRKISYKVDTHEHGLSLLHSIDVIKRAVSMKSDNVRAVLKRLFSSTPSNPDKILRLNKHEWYAFVINNVDKLREVFKEVAKNTQFQDSFKVLTPKIETFKIPLEDNLKFDPTEQVIEEYLTSAYYKYNTQMTVSGLRSTSEMLFEQYCENNKDVEWVYKNGDTGRQYMSVVYVHGLDKQFLFYPDYIIKKVNGDIWIIETKGGEYQGKSKNIDDMVMHKFNAFKKYAISHNIKWGFVRDKNNRLYINNTEYIDNLSNPNWKLLGSMF